MTEVRIEDDIMVSAKPADVWQAIKDPAVHADWHPFVTGIEGEHALGATRACHVLIGKKRGQTRERCVEDVAERRIAWAIEEDSSGFLRLVSDWKAGFRVEPMDGAGSRVTAESVFRPKNVVARVMTPLIRRKFHGAQRAILMGLKGSAERRAG